MSEASGSPRIRIPRSATTPRSAGPGSARSNTSSRATSPGPTPRSSAPVSTASLAAPITTPVKATSQRNLSTRGLAGTLGSPRGASTPGSPNPAAMASSDEVTDLSARLSRLTASYGKLRDETMALRARGETLQREKDALQSQCDVTRETAKRIAGVLADSALFQSMNRAVLKELFDNLAVSTTPVLNRLSGELAALRGRFKLLAEADALHGKLVTVTAQHERAVEGWRRARERVQLYEDGANALRTRLEEIETQLAPKTAALALAESQLAEFRSRAEKAELSLEIEGNLRLKAEADVEPLRARLTAAEKLAADCELELEAERLKAELLISNLKRARETAAQLQESLVEERLRTKAEADAHAVEELKLKRAADEAAESLESIRQSLEVSKGQLYEANIENESLKDALARLKADYGEVGMVHQREVAAIRQTLEEARELHRAQIAERGGREARIRLELTELQEGMAERIASEVKRTKFAESELEKKTMLLREAEQKLEAENTWRALESFRVMTSSANLERDKEDLEARLAKLLREKEEAEARHRETIALMGQEGETKHLETVCKLEGSQAEVSELRSKLDEVSRNLEEALKESSELRTKADGTAEENANLKQLLLTLQSDFSGVTSQIEAVANELESTKSRLAATESSSAALQTRYEDLVTSHGEATAALEQHKEDLKQRAAEMEVRVALSTSQADRMAELERDLEGRDLRIARKEAEQREEVARLVAQVAESKAAISGAEERAMILEMERNERQTQLERAEAEREEAIWKTDLEVKTAREATTKLEQRVSELEEQMARKSAEDEAKIRQLSDQRDRLIEVAERQEKQSDLETQKGQLQVQELNLKSSAVLFQLSKSRDTIKSLQLQLAEMTMARDAALSEVETLTRSVAEAVDAVQETSISNGLFAAAKDRAPSVNTATSSSVLEQAYDIMLDQMETLKGELQAAQDRVLELESQNQKGPVSPGPDSAATV